MHSTPLWIQKGLKKLQEERLYRRLEVPPAVHFLGNDYLGLSSKLVGSVEPLWGKLKARGAKMGSGGSRLLGGHSIETERVEKSIASFFGSPTALVFCTGYMANLAAMESMGAGVEVVLSDEKNHASVIEGLRAVKSSLAPEKKRVPHRQWEEVLKSHPGGDRPELWTTESLFSMDGDLCPKEDLFLGAQNRSQTVLHFDEAHSVGTMGRHGRGWAIEDISNWENAVVTVTWGKSLGLAGGALLLSHAMREWVINHSKSFTYSTAPMPLHLSLMESALELIYNAQLLREELADRAERARVFLSRHLGESWRVALQGKRDPLDERTPILALSCPGNAQALDLAHQLGQQGFGIRAIRYPTVARGEERLRVSISLAQPERVLMEFLKAYVKLKKSTHLQLE